MEPGVILLFVVLGIIFVSVIFVSVKKSDTKPQFDNTEEMKEKRSHCSNCGERYKWADFHYNREETRQYSSYSDPVTVYSIIAKCHKCKKQSLFDDLELKPKVETYDGHGKKYIRDSRWADAITKYFNYES